ncbi:MAG TPA: hypothetical protein VK421_21090 [Pyrinomonadaceae bacterium]|nr:hypothetical protein [Pyrinomonadaceae bacterium]
MALTVVAVGLCLVSLLTGCKQITEKFSVRPRALRDVQAARLAFRVEPDVPAEALPLGLAGETPEEPVAAVKAHFETNRKDEALLRTVASPDGKRVLALYVPGDPAFPEDEFLIDLYSSDGMFLRNILPPDLSAVFTQAIEWSPDGQWVAFTGRRTAKPQPSPTPTPEPADVPPVPEVLDPNALPTPTPTVTPIIAPVQTYSTEQIYLFDRDGGSLRPLTARDGLIYFHVAWAPDGHALAALACRNDELERSITENKQLAGRARVVTRDGRERLLSDELMEAPPVWSPDAAKLAAAAGTDVLVFDAEGDPPTAARLPLRDPLLTASAAYDARLLAARGGAGQQQQRAETADPSRSISFNPVVRLEWVQPELLLAQTGYVRIFQNESEPTRRYLRWHLVHLSPQAVALD